MTTLPAPTNCIQTTGLGPDDAPTASTSTRAPGFSSVASTVQYRGGKLSHTSRLAPALAVSCVSTLDNPTDVGRMVIGCSSKLSGGGIDADSTWIGISSASGESRYASGVWRVPLEKIIPPPRCRTKAARFASCDSLKNAGFTSPKITTSYSNSSSRLTGNTRCADASIVEYSRSASWRITVKSIAFEVSSDPRFSPRSSKFLRNRNSKLGYSCTYNTRIDSSRTLTFVVRRLLPGFTSPGGNSTSTATSKSPT